MLDSFKHEGSEKYLILKMGGEGGEQLLLLKTIFREKGEQREQLLKKGKFLNS